MTRTAVLRRAHLARAVRSTRTLATASVVVLAAALAACATVAPPSVTPGAERFSGRLAVRIAPDGNTPARSFSASFDLQGDPTNGRLDLSTPLGSIVAQARWSPESVVLTAPPRGETTYPDLASLTREVVGESLPVQALFDWLHARPWPGAPSEPSPAGRGFDQLGWSVDLARYADDSLVTAHRARVPAVDVRIKLDR